MVTRDRGRWPHRKEYSSGISTRDSRFHKSGVLSCWKSLPYRIYPLKHFLAGWRSSLLQRKGEIRSRLLISFPWLQDPASHPALHCSSLSIDLPLKNERNRSARRYGNPGRELQRPYAERALIIPAARMTDNRPLKDQTALNEASCEQEKKGYQR
jgi:hypothetical protein